MVMKWWVGVVAVALALPAATGCDDRSSGRVSRTAATTATAAPATQNAVSADSAQTASARQPATGPADTQPASAYLLIEGRPAQFPPARLRLTKTDEGFRALLFSDDPKKSVAAEYKGNSFYFDVPLRIADVKELPGAEFWYKARTSEREDDSPNGVFLNGMATHLQPQDVIITFDGDGPRAVVKLSGRFLVVSTNGESAPGQFTTVTGTLFTNVEVKDE
jgi:hypothetical protein